MNSDNSINLQSILPDSLKSIDIIFFEKPFKDTERYQRYFTIYQIVHKNEFFLFRSSLKSNLVERIQEPRRCFSEGKIIVPIIGDAYKVIYFSRADSECSYLYFIKDGHFFYYSMPKALENLLNSLEKKAIKPKS